jgi:PAS domain S-box-containing protein
MRELQQPHNSPGLFKAACDSSDDPYRTTLDSMRDAIHVVDSDLRILLMNEQFGDWCAELGLEMSDPIGRTIFDVFPHLTDRVREEYRQVFDSAKVLTTVEATELQDRNITTETRKIPVFEAGCVVQVVTVIRDISEQERIRQEKQVSDERIRLLFETIPHALYECDRAGVISLTNAAYSKITGYSTEELVGMHIRELMAPGPQKQEIASYLEQLAREQPAPTPYLAQNLTKDGQVIDIEVNWNYRFNGEAQVVGFVCILSDVTQRKKAEKTLQESEERFRVLSEAAFEGVVFSENGVLLDANRAFLDIYGYRYEEVVGKPIIRLVAPEHRDLVLDHIRTGLTDVYEHKGIHKDGHVVDLEIHGSHVVHQGRKLRMTAIRDVSKRKQAERKLLEYQAQLKSLTQQLTLAEEQEKRHIAELLHDDVSQCLAFCKMKLQVALASVSEPAVVGELETTCEMLTQSMDRLKNLTYDLRSPTLKELGLDKAIAAWLKDDIEAQHPVKTKFTSAGQSNAMDDNLKSLLFRSIRELVTNALKHAHPKQVQVHIKRQDQAISVCVEDDGDGFDAEALDVCAKKGFGLFSIRERLDYLGGRLELVSLPGQGCKAVLNVPLS